MGCLHLSLPLRNLETMLRRRQKCSKSQSWSTTPTKQHLPDTLEWINMSSQRLRQRDSQHWEVEIDMGFHLNQKAICSWYPLTKGKKISFLQWSLSRCITHILGQVWCLEAVGQHKIYSIVILWTFCFILHCLTCFILLVFCLYIG